MTDNADREENPRSQGVNIAIDAPTTIQPLREHVPPVSTHLEEGDKTPPCDDNANPDGGDTATGYRTPGNGCDFTRAQRMPQVCLFRVPFLLIHHSPNITKPSRK